MDHLDIFNTHAFYKKTEKKVSKIVGIKEIDESYEIMSLIDVKIYFPLLDFINDNKNIFMENISESDIEYKLEIKQQIQSIIRNKLNEKIIKNNISVDGLKVLKKQIEKKYNSNEYINFIINELDDKINNKEQGSVKIIMSGYEYDTLKSYIDKLVNDDKLKNNDSIKIYNQNTGKLLFNGKYIEEDGKHKLDGIYYSNECIPENIDDNKVYTKSKILQQQFDIGFINPFGQLKNKDLYNSMTIPSDSVNLNLPKVWQVYNQLTKNNSIIDNPLFVELKNHMNKIHNNNEPFLYKDTNSNNEYLCKQVEGSLSSRYYIMIDLTNEKIFKVSVSRWKSKNQEITNMINDFERQNNSHVVRLNNNRNSNRINNNNIQSF